MMLAIIRHLDYLNVPIDSEKFKVFCLVKDKMVGSCYVTQGLLSQFFHYQRISNLRSQTKTTTK